MSPSGGQWLDKLIGSCFGILLAAIALNCAVAIIKPILPTLIAIVGVLAILALLVGVIVVIRTWRGRW
jgi:uncharacterized membrane protein YozB (DUF420 family)